MITVTIETENMTPEEEKDFARFFSGCGVEEEAFYYDSENPNLSRHFVKNVTVKVT